MPREIHIPTLPRHRRRPGAALLAAAVLALLALAAGAPAAAARKGGGTVSGTVSDKADGKPIEGVEITLTAAGGERQTTTTDRRGRFSIKVPAGDYQVGLAREGYAPFEAPLTVEPGGGQVITVELLDDAAGRRGEAVNAYNAAVAALEAGDRATAKAGLLAAVEADPTLPEPQRVLAGIHYDAGEWAAAAAAAEAFLAARPGDAQSQRILYEAYRQLGEAARVAELRAALAADAGLAPKLAVHAFNEGVAAKQAGDAATARARYQEALELDAGLAEAHFALATLAYEAERYDEALAASEGGLSHEPGSAQGRRLVFLIQEARADEPAAAAALAAYAEVDAPGVGEIFFKRGEVDFRNGDYPAAIDNLSTVLEHQPDHAHAHRVLGLSYAASDAGKARAHLERFLELAPQDPEAATVREVLASL